MLLLRFYSAIQFAISLPSSLPSVCQRFAVSLLSVCHPVFHQSSIDLLLSNREGVCPRLLFTLKHVLWAWASGFIRRGRDWSRSWGHISSAEVSVFAHYQASYEPLLGYISLRDRYLLIILPSPETTLDWTGA